jgi:hypothetical protein
MVRVLCVTSRGGLVWIGEGDLRHAARVPRAMKNENAIRRTTL